MEPDFAKSSFCQDWLEVAVIQIVRVENPPLRRGEDEVARFVISRLLGGRSLKKLGVGIGMVHRAAQRRSKIACGVIPEQHLGAFSCTGNPCSSILQVSTATTKQKPPDGSRRPLPLRGRRDNSEMLLLGRRLQESITRRFTYLDWPRY
jgi:hypothetical protein